MTTDSVTAAPATPDDLVARAHDLMPLLRAHAERSERECTLAPEVVTSLRDAGFFRLTSPAKFGGCDLDLAGQTKVIAAVSRGCASAGWVVAAETAATSLARWLPEPAQAEIFDGQPDVMMLSTSSTTTKAPIEATAVDGGFRLSGRFGFATGCEISDWALLAEVPVKGDGPDRSMISCVVPVSELSVDRTWQVAGMCGTGTHSIVLDGTLVPEHRAVQFSASGAPIDEDQLPAVFIRASMGTLAALVGAAQGALDTVREMLAKNPSVTFTKYESAIDSPAVRQWFAEASHLVDSSVLHMTHVAAKLDGIPLVQPVPWVERAAFRMHMSSSLRDARNAVDKLLDIGGARGFAMSNPLQRYWRDLAVGSRHASFHAPTILDDYSLALWAKRPSFIAVA